VQVHLPAALKQLPKSQKPQNRQKKRKPTQKKVTLDQFQRIRKKPGQESSGFFLFKEYFLCVFICPLIVNGFKFFMIESTK
jgi:hypothetical protein